VLPGHSSLSPWAHFAFGSRKRFSFRLKIFFFLLSFLFLGSRVSHRPTRAHGRAARCRTKVDASDQVSHFLKLTLLPPFVLPLLDRPLLLCGYFLLVGEEAYLDDVVPEDTLFLLHFFPSRYPLSFGPLRQIAGSVRFRGEFRLASEGVVSIE